MVSAVTFGTWWFLALIINQGVDHNTLPSRQQLFKLQNYFLKVQHEHMLLVLLSIIFRLFLDHLQLNHHRTQSNSLSEIPFKIKKGILKVTKNKTKKKQTERGIQWKELPFRVILQSSQSIHVSKSILDKNLLILRSAASLKIPQFTTMPLRWHVVL